MNYYLFSTSGMVRMSTPPGNCLSGIVSRKSDAYDKVRKNSDNNSDLGLVHPGHLSYGQVHSSLPCGYSSFRQRKRGSVEQRMGSLLTRAITLRSSPPNVDTAISPSVVVPTCSSTPIPLVQLCQISAPRKRTSLSNSKVRKIQQSGSIWQ